jgi:general secretion pathway protein K
MRQIKPDAQGSAVLTALLLMAFMACMTILMIDTLHQKIHSTQIIMHHQRQSNAADIGEAWAYHFLDQKTIFHPIHPPIVAEFHAQYSNQSISTQLMDLQAFFNLNSLTKAQYSTLFLKLTKAQQPDIDLEQLLRILAEFQYWMGIFSIQDPQNEWSQAYAKATPSYQRSQQYMVVPEEWLSLSQISTQAFKQWRPFVVTLPEPTAINLNTAPTEILAALGKGLDASGIEHILQDRHQKKGFVISEQMDFLKKNSIDPSTVCTESHYFMVKIKVQDPTGTLLQSTLMYRFLDDSKKQRVQILSTYQQRLP